MSCSKMTPTADPPSLSTDSLQKEVKCLANFPLELISEIGSHLALDDIKTYRLINKFFAEAVKISFMKAIGNGRNVYARYASMAKFISLIQRFPLLAQNTKEICLVKDGLHEHLYRSEWAWELQMYKENWTFTEEDAAIIRKIAGDHENEMFEHAAHFYNGGGYRAMLTQLLRLLPNVSKLYVRKLSPGEHIAGWTDTDKFKQLSVYKPELDSFIHSIYYGDWEYDTVHLRKTHYIDEWGNNIIEPNAGPQASFRDDFAAARAASGFAGQVIRL